MLEIKNKSNISFFESVANHNLERFHSEVIAWIFNIFPDSAKNFIKSIHTNIPTIDKIELNDNFCLAESNQIDISLKYSYNSKKYIIIIENKMKASEHKIEAQKLLKRGKRFDEYSSQLNKDEIIFLLNKNVKLSQTEYYYFREKMSPRENIENCWYVYLKPSRVHVDQEYFTDKIKNDLISVNYDFDKLNAWNKKLGGNPWITITYEELVKTIKNNDAVNDKIASNENFIIANTYIKFIEDNIKEKVYLDDFSKNKEYAKFDYFKLLFALVKSKFKDVSILNSLSDNNEENSIYEYIEAGSSNGGMPLFAFYKKIELDKKYAFFSDNKDKVKEYTIINIGIQVQGESFKYYVSADDYNNMIVKYNKSDSIYNYEPFVKEVLKKISDDFTEKDSRVDFSKYKNGGFNPNKTKTFYSRSYKISKFIEIKKLNNIGTNKGIRDVFDIANEISEKVNHFIRFDINQTISNFENNINSK
jgi:hypothetical protein